MTGIAEFFVFDETNFINGQARVLASLLDNGTLTDQAVPGSPADVFYQEQADDYAPKAPSGFSPWFDLGALTAPPEYGPAPTINQWRIQQQIAAVKGVPSEMVRTVKLTLGEYADADILRLVENGAAPEAIGAAAGHSAFTQIAFGQFTDLNQYRLALAVMQPQDAGTVTESDGTTRPIIITQVFNRVALQERGATPYALGDMVVADVTLRCYPESGQDQNKEQGAYYIEAAGTISDS